MIGVSVMSGCPVRCRFCATGQMRRWRNLSAAEILSQVEFVLARHPELDPSRCREFKINYTRMGEPFLNIEAVKEAVRQISQRFPGAHHYLSTIGVRGADYSWIQGKTTLQISLHSLDEKRRNYLIPYKNKLALLDLGRVRVKSDLKITLNLTLLAQRDFDICRLKTWFAADAFFVKLSPINPNPISQQNQVGHGLIRQRNLI